MEHDKTSIYVDYLNQKVLPTIDYDRLQASYGTQVKDYAKSVLHLLYKAMVQCYGTDCLTEGVTDYVMVPGVVPVSYTHLRSKRETRYTVPLLP